MRALHIKKANKCVQQHNNNSNKTYKNIGVLNKLNVKIDK